MNEDKYLSADEIIEMIESKTFKVQNPYKPEGFKMEVLTNHDVYEIIIMIENDVNKKLIGLMKEERNDRDGNRTVKTDAGSNT